MIPSSQQNRAVFLRKLRDVLCRLYPLAGDAARVVDDAGLSRDKMEFQGTLTNVWHSVLQEADKHGAVPAILEVALQEYPDNAELAPLERALRNAGA